MLSWIEKNFRVRVIDSKMSSVCKIFVQSDVQNNLKLLLISFDHIPSLSSSLSPSLSFSHLAPSTPSFTLFPRLPWSLSFSPLSLTFTQSLQSYWPWFLLICILHFSFLGIWRWGTFPSLSEFTAISLCVFSEGLGYEIHIKYPLIPHYPTDKITMIMRQKF